MSVIDVNAAIGPWPHGDHAELDAAALLGEMDRLGVSSALAYHSVARYYDPGVGNRRLAEEVEVSPRLLPCFVLGPLETGEHGEPGRVGERLRRAGVPAVRLFPRDHAWALDGREGERLLRVLAAEGIPALVDLEQTGWRQIDAVLERHAALRLVVCGAGYRGLRRLLPLLDRHEGLRLDLSYFAANDAVERIVARSGPERLLFGSGMPGGDGAGALARLAWSGLRDGERERVASANAADLLGLEAGPGPGPAPGDALLEAMRGGAPLPPGIVDAHGHVGRWYAFWLPSGEARSLVAQLDRCGVEQLVLSSLLAIGPDPIGGNCHALRAVADHPGRLYAYMVASPHRPEDAPALERQLDLPGVVGLKVHPETHSCPVDDARYRWVFELARRARRPVLAHSQAGSEYCDPLRFAPIGDEFPDVPVIMAHAGITPDGFRRSAGVCRSRPSLRVDTCGSQITGRWIRWLVEEIGADRVLYGTDMPFIDMRYGLGRAVAAGLPAAAFARYAGENARELLGLPRPSGRGVAPWVSR